MAAPEGRKREPKTRRLTPVDRVCYVLAIFGPMTAGELATFTGWDRRETIARLSYMRREGLIALERPRGGDWRAILKVL